MLTQQEKRSILKKEFAEFNSNHDQHVSKDELFGYLDFKCQQQFDQSIASQLYEHMQKDHNNFITIDDFIQTYIDAEEILKNKIESSKHYLEDYYKQRNDTEQKLNEVNLYERGNLNQYGIMADSTLTVVVLDAQITRGKSTQQNKAVPYIKLQCGPTKSQTQLSNMQQPEWNEQFILQQQRNIKSPIIKGDEDLIVQLYSFEAENKEDGQFLGQCKILLTQLKHQMKHEENFNLLDETSKESRGTIKLNLQWIYSKTKYLNHVLEQWEEHIKMQEEDLIDYQRDLQIIYEPFPLLQKASTSTPMTPYSPTPRSPFHNPISPNTSSFRPIVPVAVIKIHEFENEQHRPVIMITDNFHELYHASQYIASALGLLELFAFFERCQYLDTLMLMVFGFFYITRQLDGIKLKYIAAVGFLSFILDLPWLVIYGGPWWEGQGLGDGAVYKFVVIMSVLIFFLKLSFVAVCMYLSSEYPTQQLLDSFERPSSEATPIRPGKPN